MTNEELYLNSHLSRENHFRVPEGYFDQLTADIMARLPERETTVELKPAAKRVFLRPLLAAASVACVALIAVGVYFNRNAAVVDADEQVAAVSTVMSDSYIDDAADYMMMDHKDIYAYISSDY
jgi:hypothetical protein